MSGCESPLVNNENRFETAVFENGFKSVTGEVCFDDGGTALVRHLRRVIRKLPILGVEPERCRLNASHINGYSIASPENTSNSGRTPFLPLDFYLSWMSPEFRGFNQMKTQVSAHEHLPHGQRYATSGTTPYHEFTGKPWDPDAQLFYFPFRYYSPVLARWITPDPAGLVDGPNSEERENNKECEDYCDDKGRYERCFDKTGIARRVCRYVIDKGCALNLAACEACCLSDATHCLNCAEKSSNPSLKQKKCLEEREACRLECVSDERGRRKSSYNKHA